MLKLASYRTCLLKVRFPIGQENVMEPGPVPSVKEQKRELNNQGGWPKELGGNGPYEYTERESENGQEMEGDNKD